MFDLLGLIIIGAAAGYAAGHVMKGKGFGLFGNIAVGVVGAVLGGFLFTLLGGLLAKLVTAFVGAIVLLWLIDYFKGKK
jgi:uncharacterized membrane protein YeaQ/YmgE (transglycosylase-associated protein family)